MAVRESIGVAQDAPSNQGGSARDRLRDRECALRRTIIGLKTCPGGAQ